MKQKWKKIHSSSDKIVWLNSINNQRKICYFTYEDGKTPLPEGWKRWFSSTRRLFYYTYIDNNGRKQIKSSPSKFNQHDYSPKEEPRKNDLDLEDDVERTFNLDLKDDVKRLYDTAEGNINLKWHGNTIPCIVENGSYAIYINIIGNDYDCLTFSVIKEKKIAFIELLNVANNGCPGPKEKQGSFFLLLVDEICRQLGVKSLELSDESSITSKEGLKVVKVGLELLSLMKYGRSWYERHGFVYKYQRRKDILIQISKTPISKIKKYLTDKFPKIANQVNFDKIKNTLLIIAEYEKDEKSPDSLSGFLTYVWNKNNSNNFLEYKESLSVLYPPREYEYNIPEDILPAFPTIPPSMIKEEFSM